MARCETCVEFNAAGRCIVCRTQQSTDTAKPPARKRAGRPASDITIARDKAIENAGGVDVLYDSIAAGASYREAIEAIGLEYSPQMLTAIRNVMAREPDRLEDARKASADAIAERAGEVYGEVAPTSSADAKWRNDKAGHMRWLAEMRGGTLDKDGVTVNIQTLHLEALKSHGRRIDNVTRGPADAARAFIQASGPVVDAEIVEDSDDAR